MLVRDGASGLEVFMLRRTLDAVFAGGLYVFPGGAVDDADRHPSVEAWCDGRTDDEASGVLEVPAGGLAYWIAAIRECFEEAGVLLAVGPTAPWSASTTRRRDRYLATARPSTPAPLRLIDLCATKGLRLATDGIHYVSHWITPIGERRRFDTRFFVARAPQAQEPLHDDHETIESLWVRPGRGARPPDRGELAMIPPTLANLALPGPDHATADDALRGRRACSAARRPSSPSWPSTSTARCTSCCRRIPSSTSSDGAEAPHLVHVGQDVDVKPASVVSIVTLAPLLPSPFAMTSAGSPENAFSRAHVQFAPPLVW